MVSYNHRHAYGDNKIFDEMMSNLSENIVVPLEPNKTKHYCMQNAGAVMPLNT